MKIDFDIHRSKRIAEAYTRDIKEAVEDISWMSNGTNNGIVGSTSANSHPNRFYLEVRMNEVLFMSNKEIFAFGFWHEEGRHSAAVFLEYDELFMLKEAYGHCISDLYGFPLFGNDQPLIYPPAYRALLVVKKVLSELLDGRKDKGSFRFPFD